MSRTANTPAAAATDAPTANQCRCGCNAATKAMYAPGHDARHAGQVGRAIVDLPADQRGAALAALPTQALITKAIRVARNEIQRRADQAAIAERKAARQVKVAPAAPSAEAIAEALVAADLDA